MEQFLLVLRGVPGSGKTTISKEFRSFEKKIVWLKVDAFKNFFAEDASLALEYVNGSAVATLSYLLEKGFSVVMDGVFQETSAIDEAKRLANSKNIKTIIYQLQCSLPVLQSRDKERSEAKEGCRKPLGDNIIAKIYQKLEESFYSEAVILDTENQTIEKCVEIIRQSLK